MTRNGRQIVRIFGLQERRTEKGTRRLIVRWEVDGRRFSRSFKVKALAESYRSELNVAYGNGERFDRATGEPLSWAPSPGDVSVAAWAQRWIAEQWEEWQPRTRTSAIEALTRFIPLVVSDGADDPPDGIRAHLTTVLDPRDHRSDDTCAKWLARWSRPLSDLTRANLAPVDQQLGRGLSGQPLAPGTAGRYRKIARLHPTSR